jgi:hypothetical protein
MFAIWVSSCTGVVDVVLVLGFLSGFDVSTTSRCHQFGSKTPPGTAQPNQTLSSLFIRTFLNILYRLFSRSLSYAICLSRLASRHSTHVFGALVAVQGG